MFGLVFPNHPATFPALLTRRFIEEDHRFYRRTLRKYLANLEKLFFILKDQHAGARIFQDVRT